MAMIRCNRGEICEQYHDIQESHLESVPEETISAWEEEIEEIKEIEEYHLRKNADY